MQPKQATKWLWLGWTLATLAGYTVGSLAILNWVVNLAYAAQPTLLIGFVGGAVVGGAVGGAQWLLLRRQTAVSGWWVLASLVGGALGLALGMFAADALALPSLAATTRETIRTATQGRMAFQASVTGAVVGVVLGGAQWLVLRNSLRPAGWWILANGLGWMAGVSLGAAMVDQVSVIGALLITGVISGAITGLALQRLLRQK